MVRMIGGFNLVWGNRLCRCDLRCMIWPVARWNPEAREGEHGNLQPWTWANLHHGRRVDLTNDIGWFSQQWEMSLGFRWEKIWSRGDGRTAVYGCFLWFGAFQAFSRSTTCIRSQREPLDSHESMRPFARLWNTQLAVPCGVEAVRCVWTLPFCHQVICHIYHTDTHTYVCVYIYYVYLLYNTCI